jgi:hypothetical protein
MASLLKVTSIEGFNPPDSVIFPISPTVPTPTVGDSSTKAASTAFVSAALNAAAGGLFVPVSGGRMTGALTIKVPSGVAPLRLESNTNVGAAIHFANADGSNGVGVHGYVNYDQVNERFIIATYSSGSDSPAERLNINSAGLNVTGTIVATGNVSANSDIRIKEDIQPIENALEKVQMLQGITFLNKLNPDAGRSTGLIAQAVQAVLPEAVSEAENGYLAVAYGNLVGLLVEAVKELRTQVEVLHDEIATLKGEPK